MRKYCEFLIKTFYKFFFTVSLILSFFIDDAEWNLFFFFFSYIYTPYKNEKYEDVFFIKNKKNYLFVIADKLTEIISLIDFKIIINPKDAFKNEFRNLDLMSS